MEDELERLQYNFGVSAPLYRELRKRNAVPPWWLAVSSRLEGDWVGNFHEAMTKSGWPSPARDARAGTVDVSLGPVASIADAGNVIVFPAAVVPLLWELLQAIFGALEAPGTSDPNAPMLVTPASLERAVRRVGLLIGRLRDTECPDSTCANPWAPAVIAASHFIYCHEINHVAVGHKFKQAGLSLVEEELECDRLAFALMALTYRSHPEMQNAFALMGPALAIGLEAVKDEALERRMTSGSHPRPEDRFRALQDWAATAEQHALIAAGSTGPGETFWALLHKALERLRTEPSLVTSPTRMLLARLCDSNVTSDSDQAIKEVVDVVLQWCTFGSIMRVRSALRSALTDLSSSGNSSNRRVLQRIFGDLVRETKHLERTLGFGEHLGSLYI